MKKTKLVVSLLSASLLFAGLTACRGSKGPTEIVQFSFSVALDTGYTSLKVDDTAQLVITENVFRESIEKSATKKSAPGVREAGEADDPVARSYIYQTSDEDVLTVDANGLVTAVSSGEAFITVIESTEEVTRRLRIDVYAEDPFEGIASYSDSVEQKAEILGKLEKYAMDEGLTGISLYENGGYVMYNPRVQKGVENYITGYGFGILAEGNITSDLSSETKAEWKKYYHSGSSSDPRNINMLDAEGSQVSDLGSYISSSYWSTKMNAQKNGYDWYPSLAKDNRPIAGSYDKESGVFTEREDQISKSSWYKFHVRTGEDGVKFRTLSDKSPYKDFNNRDVTIDDYVDAFKVLLTQSFGLYRGAELAADTSYGIVGADAYYAGTKEAADIDDALFDSTVGIYTGEDEGGEFLVFNMVNPVTPFYAMYGLSSNLYQPLARDFLAAMGGDGGVKAGLEKYGTFISGTSGNLATPVDTILSLGAYVLEYWEEDKTIAFMKNDNWFENSLPGMSNQYRIPGVKIAVYPGAQTDNTLIIKEFLDGKLDAAGLPTIDYIKQYRNDPRTTTTTGDAVFKLNINACTPERWEELFGENGVIAQTDKANYWDVKPWMSNKNFLRGINFSIDREQYAANRGVIASNQYFSSNYMIDPEGGLSWNASDEHEAAMADYYPDTFGYNLTAAKIYFHQAVAELVEAGDLELGTKTNPTEIEIVIEWMNPSDSVDFGEEIAEYIESAFNSSYVSDGKVKLTVVNHDGTSNYLDVYQKHLMVGQFDLGFGSVSGNSLDPLNFMEVLKSDNSSGFTLNWGPDTSVLSPNLIYNDRPWSYDALWAAGDSFAIVSGGEAVPVISYLDANLELLSDGRLQVTVVTKEFDTADIQSMLLAICIFATNDPEEYSDYVEIYAYSDGTTDTDEEGLESSWDRVVGEDGLVTYTIVFDTFATSYMMSNYPSPAIAGFDSYIYVSIPLLGIEDEGVFDTTFLYFDEWPEPAEELTPAPAPAILH